MRSSNHSETELLSLVSLLYNRHTDLLADKIRYALNHECARRELHSGYGLDFLMPVFVDDTETVHICIMVNADYCLQSIDMRVQGRELHVFCPPARFTAQPIRKDDGKSLIPTDFLTTQYMADLAESFRDVFYRFVLECVLDGSFLD